MYYQLCDIDKYNNFLIDSKQESKVEAPVEIKKEVRQCNCYRCEYLRFNPDEKPKAEEGEDPVYLQD